MRLALLALSLLLPVFGGLFGCQGGHRDPIAPESSASWIEEVEIGAVLNDGAGMLNGVLGLWSLDQHPKSGETFLTPIRYGAAQGDLFALSIRPFLKADSLQLTGVVPGADGTSYNVRFTHAFPMPADLDRPASASKRADLFLFDVELLVLADGTDSFFADTVTTNLDIVRNPDGYRRLGPLLDASQFGIESADAFPYRVLQKYNEADPDGNYSIVSGWNVNTLRVATGYDVVRQGGVVDTAILGPNSLPAGVAVAILAKYLDPRGGTTIDEKRANRLPEPGNPSAFAYYLPEAAGDSAVIQVTVEGELLEGSSTEQVQVKAAFLDWDHLSTVATSFPDSANPTNIRQASTPSNVALSIPTLRDTPFTNGVAEPSTGVLQEWAHRTVSVTNVLDMVAPPIDGTIDVPGLLRINDTQDTSSDLILLDEMQTVIPRPAGYNPSTRYQRFTVRVNSGKVPPVITGVTPQGGQPGASVSFVATTTGPAATSWSWSFGGGATPDTSAQASPFVTLGFAGTYAGTVTATNEYGSSDPFPFTIAVGSMPLVTTVAPTGPAGYAGETAQFLVAHSGSPATDWSWNFGGGAIPDVSGEQFPQVTLGLAGSYQGTVQLTNSFGTSPPFQFSYSVNPAVPPSIIGVQPAGELGTPGTMLVFSVQSTGLVENWSWNFGGGGSPNTSTTASPQVTLGAAGSYSGTVALSNRFGSSAPFGFNYSVATVPVNPPVITEVTPIGQIGTEGDAVTFQATALNAPTAWTWDFGGGTIPETSTDSAPLVTLKAGSFTGSVIASNAAGASAPFEFSFSAEALPPISFSNLFIATGADYLEPQLLLVDGRATVIYSLRPTQSAGAVHMRRCQDAVPGLAWDDHIITTKRFLPSKVIWHEGRLAMIGVPQTFVEPPGLVRIIYAQTAIPTSSADWLEIGTPADLTGTTARRDPRLATVAGRLTFATTTDEGIVFTQSTITWPQSESDFVSFEMPFADTIQQIPDTASIAGRPNIFYSYTIQRDPYILRALTPYPTSGDDFVGYALDDGTMTGVDSNFTFGVSPAGIPMIAFHGQTATEDSARRIAIASTGSPIGPSDWSIHAVAPAYWGTNASSLSFSSAGLPVTTFMVRVSPTPNRYYVWIALSDRPIPTEALHWSLINLGEVLTGPRIAMSTAFLPDDTPMVAWGAGGFTDTEDPIMLGVGDRPW